MKRLIHDIRILVMLALLVTGLESCSDVLQDAGKVQVSFTATLPTDAHTRAFGEAEKINTLVVGVFTKKFDAVDASSWIYHEMERKAFSVSGTSANVQLELVMDQTYSFVFWAYHNSQDVYDLTDLTAIKMETPSGTMTLDKAEGMDAFFATMTDITITGAGSHPVELVRPLAQVNVGTTGKSMQVSFTAKAAPDTFYPFTKTVSGATDFTWSYAGTETATFSADGKQFNYLAMGYLFAPTPAAKIDCELTLTEGTNSQQIGFSQVEIEANKRSNIAGKLTPAN